MGFVDDGPDLDARLGGLLLRDERRLRRRFDAAELEEAERRVARRAAAVPSPIRYPEALPVSERKEEILATIRDHQVVIVAGETGSGKSTQLPKICLELGRGVRGVIGHTQPRRLAARTVAERVADELGGAIGDVVGYTVRFTDRGGDRTLVKVMTDGILLAELQRDRDLLRYDTLIIDEAHERSLNVDFILGYLKQLLPRRPDLKVIVTSATIDTERFAEHFGDAPVIEVSGRTYPVEVRYRPLEDEEDPDQIQGVCDAVRELSTEGSGDVLVFLSGEREIRDTAEAVNAMKLRDTEVLPLYARLSAAEQHRIFQSHPGRRVVLATNVAETSLTVPGVRYVVDAGTARISRYSRRTKVQRLPIEPISQAAANQRAGRCGRVAPGICIRLYAEDDFEGRPEFTEPEILRTNLASVILQMTSIGLGDVAAFPFVEPPDARSIKDGVALLHELGALTGDGTGLTKLGRRLAGIPLDPRLARMIVAAEANGCVREVMVIASALSIQDPRERPLAKQQAADEQHRRFAHPDSDFLSYLNLWAYLREKQAELSSNQFRKLCRNEYLNYLRVREWQDVYSQVRQITGHLGARRSDDDEVDADAVHRSLLAGLLSQIGMRADDGAGAGRGRGLPEFAGAHNARFAIQPGSVLAKNPPKWAMAGELVETTRLWARTVARIQPEWAESVGGHLVKRSYSEPHWSATRAAPMAMERVTLYGLPIVNARPVQLGRVDPVLARELFVQHALVEGDWETHHEFVRRNRELVDEVRALEDRVRRRDVLVDERTLFEFFDERVPRDVVSGRHFDSWWKQARPVDPSLLDFTLDLLIDRSAGAVDLTGFPDTWTQGDVSLRLSYEFAPGSQLDGVTVHVPLSVLNQVSPVGFDWQVPGLRPDLVAALMRSLPKSLRRHFVPVGEAVSGFLATHDPTSGDELVDALAADLRRRTGELVRPSDWDLSRVPDHLRMNFRVEDDRGRRVAFGKDLVALQGRLSGHLVGALVRAVGPSVERTGLTSWAIGSLPRSVEDDERRVRAYPALVDEGRSSVGVRLFPTPEEQAVAMRAGTRRLLLLGLPSSPLAALQRLLKTRTKLALTDSPEGSLADLLEDCIAVAVDGLVDQHGGVAWDESSFAALRSAVAGDVVDRSMAVALAVADVLSHRTAISARLDAIVSSPLLPARLDVRRQLARLIHRGFVVELGSVDRLRDVERYLIAIEHRLDRLPNDPARDAAWMRVVQPLEARFDAIVSRAGGRAVGPAFEDARWMLEELRVGLFAQTVGTPYRISEARVRRLLDEFDATV